MTVVTQAPGTPTTLGAALGAVHEAWMSQVTAVLAPALSEGADFWTRWTAARFLYDRFGDRLRLEAALLDAVAGLLPFESVRRIAAARGELERSARELTAAGRRRGTAIRTAELARRLLDQLALWCIEVELATKRIPLARLPGPVTRLLSRLRIAADHP